MRKNKGGKIAMLPGKSLQNWKFFVSQCLFSGIDCLDTLETLQAIFLTQLDLSHSNLYICVNLQSIGKYGISLE